MFLFQRHMSRILVSMELRFEEHTKILSNIMLALSQINDSAKNTLSLSPSSNLSSDKLAAEIYSKLPLKNNEEMADLITSQIINDEDTLLKLLNAVQMVYSNTTVKEIELTTSIWLTKAPERLKNKKN
ncbi:Uncharacterized protein FWK35_00029392 [Aphis craccivora]|uniref:Uncharacterized protein n=1 Tax=Aphis craccivora TaxID=307492 RepID=A0A6G0W9B9_APHCR|nr:Uncharacterized protein FWK35_00029392 [Aphis craccivora]